MMNYHKYITSIMSDIKLNGMKESDLENKVIYR
jgi:hypothetical protein